MSVPSHPLLTIRSHISSLFASFPKDLPSPPPPSSPEANSNPLLHAPPSVKPLLLTLHVLFPNELLPALDLLDRKFVTRLVLDASHPECTNDHGIGEAEQRVPQTRQRMLYYVRSSQQPRSSRFSSGRTYDAFASSGLHYEVRLKAWNCSCPAFAFAWVGCMGDGGFEGLGLDEEDFAAREREDLGVNDGEDRGRPGGDVRFGGLMRGEGEMPVCKHLLACLLAESWRGFGGFVEERVVGREEMGGWAAGWGG
ncbi:MAG: hypothetical protein LQ338_007259 [Usnochroma carphineum]|nr:MAG: hypothetical protein LQ338_007259 [Usnochroma carphineum]